MEVREEAYPFDTVSIDDCKLNIDQTLVKQEGKDGTREVTERVTYSGDEVVGRELVSVKVTSEPVEKIIIYGGREVLLESLDEDLPFKTVRREDASLLPGEVRVIQTGIPGKKRTLYEITYNCREPREKIAVSTSEVLVEPTDEILVERATTPPGCDPNYSPCVPIASDVDCAGQPGADGPEFVSGTFTVLEVDIYLMDTDEDGIACN